MAKVLTDRDSDETELPKESEKVVEWKMTWLLHAGYTKRNARAIAERSDINYRTACDIRKRYDNEEMILRILL